MQAGRWAVAANRADVPRGTPGNQTLPPAADDRDGVPGCSRMDRDFQGDAAQEVNEVAGQVPWNPIAAGSAIYKSQLRPLPDINRGDAVEVEVRSGAARIAFVATAESAGRTGDIIAVRNPSSNRVFKARVGGKGRAFLNAGSPREERP